MTQAAGLKIIAEGDRALVMTREFNASARLVFDAMTKPELMKRWFGVFDKNTLESCEVDLRVGGKYRYVWKVSDGSLMGMGGVFKEIVAPERLVHTEVFDEAWYEGEALITSTFTEKDGKTWFRGECLYASKEARDGVLRSGMERGVTASYNNLEALLKGMD